MQGWRAVITVLVSFAILCGLTACGDSPWNNPHNNHQARDNVYHASFAERPRTLDPARSYSSNESLFTAQIYEPPLQYHYLKRPYELIPLTARALPTATYLDSDGKILPEDAPIERIAYSVYNISIKPGIRYQPHPAFAKDSDGAYLYHNLDAASIDDIVSINDFTHHGTRELTAADYVYQIKRLAHPTLQSPILGLMSEYIVGLAEFNKQLREQLRQQPGYLDLRTVDLSGVQVLDRYTYQIKIKGKYPQLLYWLAMPFFSPMAWEVDRFYSQAGLDDHNISLDWYPVGTGPYMLTENNPNARMVLSRNPNFRGETYPSIGAFNDRSKGLLDDAGKSMPFIDAYVFSLEKESIPRWNKFLQGYYDAWGDGSMCWYPATI